jgi:two-component system, NarL family, sensor histidine kinase DesK
VSAQQIHGVPQLTRLLAAGVLCSCAAMQERHQLTRGVVPVHGLWLVADMASSIIQSALAVAVTSGFAETWAWRRRLGVLIMSALLTYLPVIVSGAVWTGMAGCFAGAALVLLNGWRAWALFASAAASMILISVVWGLSPYDFFALPCSSLVIGAVIFGLARLSQIVRSADARTNDLVQLAIINERTCFAKDLHDLLGYSLSAVILKAEFTRRLVDRDPGRARDELTEVLDIARQSLADVREAAGAYRSLSLAKEATPVASLLAAAGISAKVEINCGRLGEEVDTVLAIVLREAVTNVLWHSSARDCTIEALVDDETVRLRVTNDGVPCPAPPGRVGGSGLKNLSARLNSIGGQLTADIRDDWFILTAEAPLTGIAQGQR